MSFILNIDTAVESASVCLSQNETILAVRTNNEPRESAAWLHSAILQLMQQQGVALQQLSAVAISIGPGSYTGLRVGLAAAKGICYALQKPLITINTLQMMAAAAVAQKKDADWLCPMIDARRMEVFTAFFDQSLNEVVPSAAVILSENAFAEHLRDKKIFFFGNGSKKFSTLQQSQHAVFGEVAIDATHLSLLAYKKLMQNNFTDLAYSEPLYIKDFFNAKGNK